MLRRDCEMQGGVDEHRQTPSAFIAPVYLPLLSDVRGSEGSSFFPPLLPSLWR